MTMPLVDLAKSGFIVFAVIMREKIHVRSRNALLNIRKYMSSTDIIRNFGRIRDIPHLKCVLDLVSFWTGLSRTSLKICKHKRKRIFRF